MSNGIYKKFFYKSLPKLFELSDRLIRTFIKEEIIDDLHTLILFGFGQITIKSASGQRSTSSIQTIKFKTYLNIPYFLLLKHFMIPLILTYVFYQDFYL